MDVCHQRQLGPMRAEKRRVPRGVSEVHVLGNRMADAGEVGEQHHERDIRIDFANPVRDLGTEIHEERMLGLRVDKAGKISSEHHWICVIGRLWIVCQALRVVRVSHATSLGPC